MTAIDLYSGIGGWTLGLKAAGISVIKSYEWWDKANKTQEFNFGDVPPDTDIRKLDLALLPNPKTVDLVVGSPPCTQFSFSNRGGNGDIADGLVDIRKFLEIVRYLRPKYWAMENVPRVATILEQELEVGGRLHEFKSLVSTILVVDASEFGVPQSRKRMIAGRFDADLLLSYRKSCTRKSLGDVIEALAQDRIIDPNWGTVVSKSALTDHLPESPLTPEEVRINKDAKTHHPVYNKMSFPDDLRRPARTVTATCTRVSRESIVIPLTAGYRRLTIRERASLQGFPITYQFGSGKYGDRTKMIGNAVPPVLTYFIANALMQKPATEVLPPEKISYTHKPCRKAKSANPTKSPAVYPMKRSFRFAIPGLRFHSGVRFELKNSSTDCGMRWKVSFYYGNSKKISEGPLELAYVKESLAKFELDHLLPKCERIVVSVAGKLLKLDGQSLQDRWIGRSCDKGAGPIELLDQLGTAVPQIEDQITRLVEDTCIACVHMMYPDFNERKWDSCWKNVLAGAILGSIVNAHFGSERNVVIPPLERNGQHLLALERNKKKAARLRAALVTV